MHEMQYSVAVSKAGHDKGRLFAIMTNESAEYVLIADGKSRKLQKPKRKKMKHLELVGTIEICSNAFISNRGLWKALRKFEAESCAAAEGGF